MSTIQKTCVLLKPDAVIRGLCGEIISRFEKKGLKIIGCKMIRLDEVLLKEHYVHVAHESFFEALSEFMQSSPILAIILQGENAVEIVRKMTGKTMMDFGTIRGDFTIHTQKNIIHSSDTLENAIAEISRFFEKNEIFE